MEWTQCDALDPGTWSVLAVARRIRVRAGSVRRVGVELCKGRRSGKECVCAVVRTGSGMGGLGWRQSRRGLVGTVWGWGGGRDVTRYAGGEGRESECGGEGPVRVWTTNRDVDGRRREGARQSWRGE